MSRRDSFLDQLDTWGTFILTNLAWIIFSIPIVTMPLATVGLFQVMSKWARGKQPEFFKDFFGAIRQYWRQALMIGLLDVLVGGLVYLNIRIMLVMELTGPIVIMSRSVTLFTGLVLLLANLYIWSLLVIAELPLRKIIIMSFQLVIAHPVWTSGVLIAGIAPILVSLVLPRMIFLFGTISVSALIVNKGTWRVIRQYLPEDELKDLEARHSL